MNIVIIPAFFATKNRPTLGNFFFEQAKALYKAGHKVTIFYCDTYSVKLAAEYFHYKEERESIVEGIYIYRKPVFCPLKHGIEGHEKQFTKGIVDLFVQYMNDEKVDIIHAHCCMWAGTAARQLENRYGIPYLITEHATVYQLQGESISSKNREKIKQAFEQAKKVICVSPKFAEALQPFMGKQKEVTILGNIVDCGQFGRQQRTSASQEIQQDISEHKVEHLLTKKQRAGKHEENKKVFTFFSLCYMDTEAQLQKKGMDLLIQAFAQIERKYPQVQLRIGGGGNAVPQVKKRVEDENLKQVTFLGNLAREQVVEEMQNCQCFVLPSRYETFGVVYIEAMACGKPVIGVANGGPDGFITEQNGLLIGADVVELEKAMEHMVEHSFQYNEAEIRKYVRAHFSGDVIAEKLTEIYKDVLD